MIKNVAYSGLEKNRAKSGKAYGLASTVPIRRQYPVGARTVSIRLDREGARALMEVLRRMVEDEEVAGDIVLTGHGSRLTVLGSYTYQVGPPRG